MSNSLSEEQGEARGDRLRAAMNQYGFEVVSRNCWLGEEEVVLLQDLNHGVDLHFAEFIADTHEQGEIAYTEGEPSDERKARFGMPFSDIQSWEDRSLRAFALLINDRCLNVHRKINSKDETLDAPVLRLVNPGEEREELRRTVLTTRREMLKASYTELKALYRRVICELRTDGLRDHILQHNEAEDGQRSFYVAGEGHLPPEEVNKLDGALRFILLRPVNAPEATEEDVERVFPPYSDKRRANLKVQAASWFGVAVYPKKQISREMLDLVSRICF